MTMTMNRREFSIKVSAVAGGMVMGMSMMPEEAQAAAVNGQPWGITPTAPEFTPWLQIARDGTCTVRVTSPELGNGLITQFAMTMTEELQCD